MGSQTINRAPTQTLGKTGGTGIKGVNLQQSVLQTAVSGQTLGPESVLSTQHITNLPSGESL